MSDATVTYGLKRYGATMALNDILEELRVSERTFREGVKRGTYPKPRNRGAWPTELIMRAAVGEYGGANAANTSSHDEGDPFVQGAVS